MTRRIIVCDDEEPQREDACERLRPASSGLSDLSVEAVSPEAFKIAVEVLEDRRAKARGRDSGRADEACVFDTADFAFVDYDLIEWSKDLTGESIAYLARCYSHGGLIIVVNQDKRPNFDLTLRDHVESFGDLNLNTRSLANLGLWRGPFAGYRPWAWPLLQDALARWERRQATLMDQDLDTVKVLDALDLRQVEDRLPRQTLAFLEGVSGQSDPTVTQFVRDSGQGLDPKDQPLDRASVVRIACGRLARWVDVLVAGGQDILIDGPHLVAAFPFLLGGAPTIADANGTAVLDGVGAPLANLESFPRPDLDLWTSRPTWILDKLLSNEALSSSLDPSRQPLVDYVFCEDVSRFLPRDHARRFIADLPTRVAQRFVMDPNNLADPTQELADLLGLADPGAVTDAFSDITYAPGWRFSQ